MGPNVPVFDPASPEAREIQWIFLQILAVSAVIFTVVAAWVAVAVIRGRKRTELPKQTFGNYEAEAAWIVIPVLIVIWLAAVSSSLVFAISAYPPDESVDKDRLELIVRGHQWWWEIEYPAEGVVAANEIHIAAGKKYLVRLESADVIHSFWAPQLGRKMDAIPGHPNYMYLEADAPGVYEGRCTEFCGDQHAWMEFTVYAHTNEDYRQWLAEQRQDPDLSAEQSAAQAGRKLFTTFTCYRCHTIAGTPAEATIGPNLTHVASRHTLAGGAIENSPANLRRFLHDPQAVKPGAKMPNFKLSEEHLDQLVAFLETLK